MPANQVLEEMMIEAKKTTGAKDKTVDAANIGDVIYLRGTAHKVDITYDGRRIAYPLVPEERAHVA